MKVTKTFQPITIYIERKEEAELLESALNCLIEDTMRRHGSKWFGFRDVPLKDEHREYRNMARRILEAINPDYKNRPLYVTSWS